MLVNAEAYVMVTIACTNTDGDGLGVEYAITPDTTTADEGDTVTFDITAPTDDDLYYQITGDITADDIASGTLTGTITITAGVGSLAVVLLEDGTLEGSEDFAVELYADSGLTELVATSATVTVADTSTAKVYSIAHDATPAVVSEGAVVTYTLTTEGVVDGSRLWWRCKDTGETETVVVENAAEVEHYTGTITATGASTLTDSAAVWTVDQWAGESVETAGETLVIVSNTTDTLTLAAPWAVEPTGGYRIITPADTTEYSAGSSISSQDTVEGETSFLSEGPIEIVGGTGTFALTLRADLITEGSEYIILDIYDEPGSPFGDGEPVATSEPVIVLDTSTSADYDWTGTTFVFGTPVEGETGYASEGATVSVTITASPPPPDGTRLRMQVLGTVDGSDYTITGGSGWVEFDGVSGTVSWGITLDEDVTTEGPETLQIQARTGWPASDGDIVYTSPLITVGDTSQAAPTYAVTPDDTTVNEGDVVVFDVACTTVAPGTILYWTLAPGSTVDAADFVGGATSGEVEITSGDIIASSGAFALTLAADATTEDMNLVVTGTATGGTASTLEDSGASWDVDAHAGRLVIIESGTGAGQVRMITANTSAAMTVAPDWATPPDATSAYRTIIEFFAVELRTGSAEGPVVDATDWIIVNDTSLTPPVFSASVSRESVPEGEGFYLSAIADWFLGDTLYITHSGTAGDADFVGGLPETLSLSETTYPRKTGSVLITVAQDELIEGPETISFQLRTGSTGGPIVATAGPVTIIDEAYTLTPDRTLITEGDTVVFTAAAIHSNPSATLYWTVSGTIDTDDVVGGALSGSVTLSGGEGTISITLAVDLISDGAEYFYLELRRGSTSGAILAVSPAVVVRESIIDYDAWLGSLDGVRILLVEMDHSAGTVYFGNYPYTSKPGDTNPNRPYDDTLQDAVDIETRIDGAFTLGEVTVVNDGRHDAWVTYDWHGYPIRFLMGEPGWSLDDFRLVALATNGGLDGIERGLLRFAIYDAKAIFAQPLQTTLLADGNPVPVAVGKPFNVAPRLISVPDDEYQVHEGAIVAVTPRDNGADVASADNLAGGTFELSAAPQGTVTADVETSLTTPTAIIAWVCNRYGVAVDGDTLDDLPTYDIGLYYDSQATGADVLTHVCQSIGGYWLRGADGEVEVYILDEPAETADIELDYQTEIAEGGLRLVAMEEPVKTLTLNYKRNWAPQARDSLAGSVITGSPAFADELTKEWRQIAITNSVADHPLAQDAVMDTYLVNSLDAYAEANRVAGLRAVRRERWEVECFLAQAAAQVGKTVKITYPGWGFETGRNARIVAVSRQLSRGRVTLEVWL